MSKEDKYLMGTFIFVSVIAVIYIAFVTYVIDPKYKSYSDKLSSERRATETVYVETYTEPVIKIELETDVKTKVQTTYKYYDVPLSHKLQREIIKLCDKYDFKYETALAIIKTESEFTVDVIGDSGKATGLCQIWSYYWGDLAEERGLNLNDPVDNVEVMLIIMTEFLEDHTLTEALQMYNTGSPEGNDYADRVYANLYLIESEGY